MSLEISKDVPDKERLKSRFFQIRIPAAITRGIKQRNCCRKKSVEYTIRRIKNGLYVSYPSVMNDRKILNMTRTTPNLVKLLETHLFS